MIVKVHFYELLIVYSRGIANEPEIEEFGSKACQKVFNHIAMGKR